MKSNHISAIQVMIPLQFYGLKEEELQYNNYRQHNIEMSTTSDHYENGIDSTPIHEDSSLPTPLRISISGMGVYVGYREQ